MGSSKQKRLPAVVGELLAQVETWRRTREKRGPMPEELWSEAVVLAKEHGTCRIARAVGIDYASLRGRLQRSGTAPTRQDESSGSFVELPTTVPAGRLACRCGTAQDLARVAQARRPLPGVWMRRQGVSSGQAPQPRTDYGNRPVAGDHPRVGALALQPV